jgi:AAA family ATP:ADP antiporter
MALSPVGVVVVVYVYGRLLSWLGPSRALLATSLLSGAVIVGCYAALVRGSHLAAGVVFVFREGYIVLIIEQYWSFINSVLREEDAKRVNGPICGVASLGAIVGGMLVQGYAVQLGSETLLLFAAASLVPAGALSWLAYRVGGEPQPAVDEAGGKQGHLALGVFLRTRYLLLLALLIWLAQMVSTVLDLRFNGLVEQALPLKDLRTSFLGGFFWKLNVVSAVLQFVAAPLLLRHVPLRWVHPAIPLVHIGACAALILYPSLTTAGMAFLLFKSLDYSVFRAAKELLYLPLSFDARYRAKQLIDSFGYRFAKGTTSALIGVVGRVAGALPGAAYPGIAIGACVAWVAVVRGIIRGWQGAAAGVD